MGLQWDCSSFSVTELIFQDVFWNMNRSIFRGSICIFSWFSGQDHMLLFNVFVLPFLKLDASVQNHNKITSYHNSRYVLSYCTKIHNINYSSEAARLTHCVFPDGHWFQSLSHFHLSFMISLMLLYWCARHDWDQSKNKYCTKWVWFAWMSMGKKRCLSWNDSVWDWM